MHCSKLTVNAGMTFILLKSSIPNGYKTSIIQVYYYSYIAFLFIYLNLSYYSSYSFLNTLFHFMLNEHFFLMSTTLNPKQVYLLSTQNKINKYKNKTLYTYVNKIQYIIHISRLYQHLSLYNIYKLKILLSHYKFTILYLITL